MARLASAHVVLLQKIWQALSGFITALIVTQFLSGEEQGYYYAIGSLLSACVLLDLGLSGLLVQLAARLSSNLEAKADYGTLSIDGFRSDFKSMVSWSRGWYLRTAVASLLLLPVGFLYFTYAKPGLHNSQWQWPWIVAVVSVALSLPAYPLLSIIEGCGRIAEVYWVRLIQYGFGAVLAWAFLIGGLGLYAPAMAPLAIALVVQPWAWTRYRSIFLQKNRSDGIEFNWRNEVWPVQRKVAVSWLANYLFLNVPTLLIFYCGDASSAGRLGLSVVAANLVGSMCASWMVAKVPRITQLATQGEIGASKRLFSTEFKKASRLMFIAYGLILAIVSCASSLPIAKRILPPYELGLLFLAFLLFHSIGMVSVYFRAQGKELLAIPTMLATLLAILISSLLVPDQGIAGILYALFFSFVVPLTAFMLYLWKHEDQAAQI
jgi:hypothetical protein